MSVECNHPGPVDDKSPVHQPRRVTVIGGSGAIGHAMAEQLSHQGHHVTATYRTRKPATKHINWLQMDIEVEESVRDGLMSLTDIDWIINTVGLLHTETIQPEKTIRRFSPEDFAKVIAANTIPTLTIAKYAMPLLRRSEQPKFASISARVGSIGDNRLGGWYSYRCSKAALNMAIKTLSLEWKHALPNAVVTALHPGTVKSPLSAPFAKGQRQVMTPTESANHLIQLLTNMTSAETGQFMAWDGKEIAW